jgi:hypothetical protein
MKVTSIYGKDFEISTGMEIFVPCRGRGGHGAYVEVTKLNKVTFNAIERKGSYTPGTTWKIHKDATYAIVTKPDGLVHMNWINDD